MLSPTEILTTYIEWILTYGAGAVTLDLHANHLMALVAHAGPDGRGNSIWLVMTADGITRHKNLGAILNGRCISCSAIVAQSHIADSGTNRDILDAFIAHIEQEAVRAG